MFELAVLVRELLQTPEFAEPAIAIKDKRARFQPPSRQISPLQNAPDEG